MPPLPPSSSGGAVGVVSSVVGSVVVVAVSRFRGRRLGRGRLGGRRVLVVVSAVVVGTDSELEAVELPPLSLPAITITATTRPTITAIRQATSRRMLPCGRSSVGALAVGAASSASGPRALSPPVRVSRRGSRSVSSISKPFRSRASISSRLLPETAIWVASRRAPAGRRGRSGSAAGAGLGQRRLSTGATAVRCEAARSGRSRSCARDRRAARRAARRPGSAAASGARPRSRRRAGARTRP